MSYRCTNSTPSSAPSTRAWSCDSIVAFETYYHGVCASHFFKSRDIHSMYHYSCANIWCVRALLGIRFSIYLVVPVHTGKIGNILIAKIGNILIVWWDQWLDVRGSCMQWQRFCQVSCRKGPCMSRLLCSLARPTRGRVMSFRWIHTVFLRDYLWQEYIYTSCHGTHYQISNLGWQGRLAREQDHNVGGKQSVPSLAGLLQPNFSVTKFSFRKRNAKDVKVIPRTWIHLELRHTDPPLRVLKYFLQ